MKTKIIGLLLYLFVQFIVLCATIEIANVSSNDTQNGLWYLFVILTNLWAMPHIKRVSIILKVMREAEIIKEQMFASAAQHQMNQEKSKEIGFKQPPVPDSKKEIGFLKHK